MERHQLEDELIAEGNWYGLMLRWAREACVQEDVAFDMVRAGVLERVHTTRGSDYSLVPGLSMQEAVDATKAWLLIDPPRFAAPVLGVRK